MSHAVDLVIWICASLFYPDVEGNPHPQTPGTNTEIFGFITLELDLNMQVSKILSAVTKKEIRSHYGS